MDVKQTTTWWLYRAAQTVRGAYETRDAKQATQQDDQLPLRVILLQ